MIEDFCFSFSQACVLKEGFPEAEMGKNGIH
jgi:hypothetical protein